jgi:hypothetical protein
MIVDAELLPETPKAFQDYVAQYFTEASVLGKRVFVATTKVCGDRYGRGYAPAHSVDLMRFKDGLEPKQSLNDWMCKAEGTVLWQFAGGYDSDNVIDED